MTSNMGAHLIQERFENLDMKRRDEVTESTKKEILKLLQQNLRPEFLNRIDEIIMFTPLNEEEIEQIVRLQLNHLQKVLKEQQVELEYTEASVKKLAQLGYDPQFGARPVKRVIQREILNELSKEILAGRITSETKIILDAAPDGFVFKNN
jgi:ATP-dependent Clp protease ATP-binding subunit ClpB